MKLKFALLFTLYLSSLNVVSANEADFNNDGKVDYRDLVIFTDLFDKAGCPVCPPIDLPNIPTDASITQFLTWDAGSGPNKTYWSDRLKLKWTNEGSGDWLDKNETEHGFLPYARQAVSTIPGKINLDVTLLVNKWVVSKVNKGFYLDTDQAFPFTISGRTPVVVGNAPVLRVVTDNGEFLAPIVATTGWTTSSFKGLNTRSSFKVSNSIYRSIIQFDLSKVTGNVTSASLTLNILEAQRAGNLSIYEANPPTFRIGAGGLTPQIGLAAKYINDKDIGTDPDVIYSGDFAESNINSKGWSGSCGDFEQIKDDVSGETILRHKFTAGQVGSCNLTHNVTRGDTSGVLGEIDPKTVEKELYARYYVFLEDDWGSVVDGNKMPGWDTRLGWWNVYQDGYWQATTGNGGAKGTGLKVWNGNKNRWEYEGHSIRGLGGSISNDGNPYDDLIVIGSYMYHIDQNGAFGSDTPWQGTVITKGKWYSIEQYVKINTISPPFDAIGNGTANKDGVFRVWVDGVMAYEQSDLRWSRHEEIGLQGFWLNWYHGGRSAPIKDMHYKMKNIVIARKYIGLMSE